MSENSKNELACQYVYVVATGGYRFAVETELPTPLVEVAKAAILRFERLGCDLGKLMEITECSDAADPSDPHYVSTESILKLMTLPTPVCGNFTSWFTTRKLLAQ